MYCQRQSKQADVFYWCIDTMLQLQLCTCTTVTVVISPILQVLNIRKFLQQVHSSGDGSSSPHPLFLPPDVFMEVGDIVFQLCDDPFEVKLRANYEVYVWTCNWTHFGVINYHTISVTMVTHIHWLPCYISGLNLIAWMYSVWIEPRSAFVCINCTKNTTDYYIHFGEVMLPQHMLLLAARIYDVLHLDYHSFNQNLLS